ncbi:MAG TPA: TIGR02147 family protein, partial [Bdellovibrio sp.]|nr:TIGR02147 family protein [Bdellovibrio sp.]
MTENEIFKYNDYRPFLRDYLRAQRVSKRGKISHLAQEIGVNLSVLSLVLKGDRDLSPEHAYEISEHFAWSTPVKEYFVLLNQYQRAGTHKLKKHLLAKIEAAKKQAQDLAHQVKKDMIFSEEQKSVFYSHFIFSAVRMACSFEKGQSIEDLLQHFPMARAQMTEVVRFLLENKLLIEKDARFFIGPQATHLERKSVHFKQNHTNWRVMGLQMIDQQREQDLYYTAPFAISREDYKKFRQELTQLIKNFVNTA